MNKRAFTLIEVIAIIAVLGIMAVLVLPKISGSVKDRKESQYNNIVTTIENAAKVYYADNQDAEVVSMQDLADQDYLAASIINPVTGTVMNGCVSINKDSDGYNVYDYHDDCSALLQKIITLNLNGGASSQTLNSSYLKGDVITLVTPTKSGVVFSGWSATCTSCLSGSTYTVGKYNDTILANWETAKVITLNLNGGTSSQTLNSGYIQGDVITLTTPIKTGYSLYSWSATCTSCLSGNTYTVGTSNDTIVANWVQTVMNYGYTGGAQTFSVLASGNYLIEAWGAQGGYYTASYPTNGTYGGYSRGNIYFSAGQNIYIYVGGKGTINCYSTSCAASYNGGGAGGGGNGQNGSSGGGATHLAMVSGLLSSLSSNQSSIIIVAGGGGGTGLTGASYGGSGGGISGGTGADTVAGAYFATGASQTAPGYSNQTTSYTGSFGSGSNFHNLGYSGSGGGGGFYGGGGSSREHGGAGGGSGYIGNSNLSNKYMYCYNCTTSTSPLTYTTTNYSSNALSNYAKAGDGYVKITFINS